MRNLLLFLALICIVGTAFALDIVIDAEKDPFYDTLTGPEDGYIFMSSNAGNDNGFPDDDFDLSALFWCAWDTSYFYYYEEVTDDWVTCNNATVYQNDCLELKFDPDPYSSTEETTGVFAVRLTALDSADAEELAGVDNMAPENNSFATTNDPSNYARRLTDVGYVLEGRLLWDDIMHEPQARGPVIAAIGEIFGMAVMNHDNDDAEREGSVMWASHMSDAVWNNPDMHGTVTFLEGNKLRLSTENFITLTDTNMVDFTPPSVGVTNKPVATPNEYLLAQNYPNPFNPTTSIEFSIPIKAMVTLHVYDMLGNEIAELVNGTKSAGNHVVRFDGSNLPSGIYLYQLTTGDNTLMKKMMLIK